MQTFADTLLSKFDSAVRQFGPINKLIDTVVSRVAPTVEVKACGGSLCGVYECLLDSSCGYNGWRAWGTWSAEGGCGSPYTYQCSWCTSKAYCNSVL